VAALTWHLLHGGALVHWKKSNLNQWSSAFSSSSRDESRLPLSDDSDTDKEKQRKGGERRAMVSSGACASREGRSPLK
jgi:hypothetical protein